jgi:hypothetical protein
VCNLKAPRYRGHTFPFLDQRGDESPPQSRTAKGKAANNAVQVYEGSGPADVAKCFSEWHALNPLMPYSGQLRQQVRFVSHVRFNGVGNIVNGVDHGIFSHVVTSLHSPLEVGYLLTREGATEEPYRTSTSQ